MKKRNFCQRIYQTYLGARRLPFGGTGCDNGSSFAKHLSTFVNSFERLTEFVHPRSRFSHAGERLLAITVSPRGPTLRRIRTLASPQGITVKTSWFYAFLNNRGKVVP